MLESRHTVQGGCRHQAGLLWKHTAPGYDPFAPLTESCEVEVAVIGGGVTGVTTALHLAKSGCGVALFEAETIAYRASGRNGGQVVPGLKPLPSMLVHRFGEDAARSMLQLAFAGPDMLFQLVDHYGIDCSPSRNGWIQAAFSARSAASVQARGNELRSHGGEVRLLGPDDMLDATGSVFWHAGLEEKRAGSVQPLAYLRGLAVAAASEGAMLYENSPVRAITAGTGVGGTLVLNGCKVQARKIVIATDSYTSHLWPAIAQSYVVVSSAQIATEPLPDELLKQIIPKRVGISEARKITYYCRIDPEGRFVIGGRGKVPDKIDPATRSQLRRAAVLRFPELINVSWPYGWACRVGMTLDDLPHLENPAPGIWASYGYCGRGMAMGTAMGHVLAKAVLSESPEKLEYPVTPASRIPFYPLRQTGASLLINWYRLRDALGLPI